MIGLDSSLPTIVDDLLVWGEGIADHDVNLKKVLERVREVGRNQLRRNAGFALTEYPMLATSSQIAVSSPMKLQLLKKCQHQMCERYCVDFLA